MESTNSEEQENSKTKDDILPPTVTGTRKKSSASNRRRFKRSDLETGQLRLSDTKLYQFTLHDLINHDIIANGYTSTIHKMTHKMSGTIMAVKYIYLYEYENQKKIYDELNIFMRENICPHIIQFYGIIFDDGIGYICMELMNRSLDDFYLFIYDKMNQFIPENILAYITLIILETLDYLKSRWKIIHRNVKPSNILISRTSIKLSNFGIINQIENSSRCVRYVSDSRTYLSPERLVGTGEGDDYDVRSSVWSLGIIIYEISAGYFPLRECRSMLDKVMRIIKGPPLKLTIDRLSDHCKNFVDMCLIKDANQRPRYDQLLEHPFLDQPKQKQQIEYVTNYLSNIIDCIEQNTDTFE